MKSSTAEDVKQMMLKVVEEGTGTPAQLGSISVAGKTGTAQIGAAEIRAMEIGDPQIGPEQRGVAQPAAHHLDAQQFRPGQIGLTEIHVVQHQPSQISELQIRAQSTELTGQK